MPQNKPRHDHGMLKFPKDFLWGTATSAYQVEGNNINADWEDFKSAGLSCDEYNLYEKDFDIAHSLGQNAQRLSIEWSRIQPREGVFDQTEINHYKKVLEAAQKRGMKVMLTLWHYTLPKWVADKGGWENSQTVDLFAKFITKVAPELKSDVDFWVILNEPDIYVYQAYVLKVWPGNHGGAFGQIRSYWNLAQAYKKAYRILKKLTPNIPTGLAQNIQSYEAFHKHSIREQLDVLLSDAIANHLFYFLTKGCHDFYGVNYYFHWRYNTGHKFLPEIVSASDEDKDVSDLGWEVYPEGIFDVLTDLSDDIPIYITECGIASTNDDRRTRFLLHYLQEVYQAIKSGIDVRGFFYWSLVDNFEWERGFEPKFGLVEIDYQTQSRIIRPSAEVYREIAAHNGIPHKLLKLLGHSLQVRKELTKMIRERQL